MEKLAELENNYQILEIENSTFEKSIVCKGMEGLPELSFERQFFEIMNLDNLKDGIEEINYVYIKWTKDIVHSFVVGDYNYES